MFATAIHFHPSLIFAGKAGACQSGAPLGFDSYDSFLALPENIILGLKLMLMTHTLAYYDMATNYDSKTFYSPGPCTIKLFNASNCYHIIIS